LQGKHKTSSMKSITLAVSKCKQFQSIRGLASGASARLRFDGQTAIVSGAGRGLGREYALLLASRGANVVVNDFGGGRSGEQSSGPEQSVADQVVGEIAAMQGAGRAIASYDSVMEEEGVERLVGATLDSFGRIDILVNNAGILRDKSFAKMTTDDWDQVNSIHLRAAFLLSRACWPQMRKQEYGKIVMTSSTSGLFGNFGQANYAAAKMGLIGLSNTLAVEGKRNNICSNTIVPLAASRMTQDIIPEDFAAHLKPAYVAPLVCWLCHRDCTESGSIFEAAGQWFGRYKLHRARGKYLPGVCQSAAGSLECIADNWNEISQLDAGATHVGSFTDHLGELLKVFESNKVKA